MWRNVLFSDASFKASGAVAYFKTTHEDGQINNGFVLVKAKLTPADELTIPRSELCTAVLAVEISDLFLDEINFKPDSVKFFCDNNVILGYIHNESRRFYVYVHNHKESGSHRRLSNSVTCLPSTVQLTVLLGLFQPLFLQIPCG